VAPETIQLNDLRDAHNRGERFGWYMYDWANSPFSSSVVTLFLGPYLTSLAQASADGAGFIYPLGVKVLANSFFPYLVSLSALSQVVALPYLSALADLTDRKKENLIFFAYAGALATVGMYWVTGPRWMLGGLLFLIANLGLAASKVFYNALLPEIAPPQNRDSVSCRGWAIGYLGGGLLLAAHLLILWQAPSFGLSAGEAVRVNLGSTGAWWAAFTLIPLLTLRRRRRSRIARDLGNLWRSGLERLRSTFKRARRYPQTLLFLAAYTIYNNGILTVLALATQFGQEEMKIPIATLTVVILMVQFLAFFGSLFFIKVAAAGGAKKAVMACLLLWIVIVGYAYALMYTVVSFFLMAAAVAVVMGGSQALSRSLFAGMIPRGEEAEYFSLYEVSSSGTSWLGPLAFGLALQLTGSYRTALLSLIAFFAVGAALLSRVDVSRAGRESESLTGNLRPT
jgi:MFS transporter, UMF1 family